MSSENASQTTTSHCFRCNHHPGLDDDQLKRCGRCRARHYCSADCQTSDWPRHKKECRILAEGGEVSVRQRTTFPLQGPLHHSQDPDPAIDPHVIYYLKTSKLHIQDISISGPFYPLDKVFDQLHIRMMIEKSTGESILDELVFSGMFLSVEHFDLPLPGGKTMRFQLLQEKNAEVASSLPGTVWNVIVTTPSIRQGTIAVAGSPHPPVEEIDIQATFLTMEAANSAAEKLLEKMKVETGGGASIEKLSTGDLIQGFVSPISRGANPRIVEVRREDCEIQRVERFGDPIQA